MSTERYYWRSDPAAEPVRLPNDWARAEDEPGRKQLTAVGIARFLRTRLMKDEAARSYAEAERLSKIALRGHQQVPTLRATGIEARRATVLHIHDTQQSINEDPVLVLTVELDGRRSELVALVPRTAVPRPGEHVAVVDSPDRSTLLYAGLRLQ